MQSTECLQINSKNSILHHAAQQVIVKASLLRSHCSKQCASPIGPFHRLYAWRNTCHAQNTSRQQNRQRECRYKCRYKCRYNRSRATVVGIYSRQPTHHCRTSRRGTEPQQATNQKTLCIAARQRHNKPPRQQQIRKLDYKQ